MDVSLHISDWQPIEYARLRELDLPNQIWAFGVLGQAPYHRYFRMLHQGRIGGHRNPNETRWEFRDGFLVLLNAEGIVTTRVDRLETNGAGKLRMIGPMVTDPTGNVTHCWEQIEEPYSIATDPAAFKMDRHPSGKPRRNLVIMGANEQSLHHEWPQNIAASDRNWDLCISFYGKKEHYPPAGTAEYTSLQPGLRKWLAIYRAFYDSSPLWQYERIFVLDDDIRTSWLDINRFFEIVESLDLVLAQPSLTPGCHVTHPITEQQPDCLVRFTTFVEAMAPCFTADALRTCIATAQGAYFGFGIDHLWPRILGLPKNRIGIVDAVAMEHTRPLAVNYSLHDAMLEQEKLFQRYGMGGGIGYLETGRIWQTFRDASQQPQPAHDDGPPGLPEGTIPHTIVAFRTHVWNDGTDLLARRLLGAAAGLHFCVLADETRGQIGVPKHFETLSHTDDFSDLGLPRFPGEMSLWYNADYPLYRLRRSYPNAGYFVMSEFDVLANVNLARMLDTVARDDVDLVAAEILEATDQWAWHRTLTNFYSARFSCFMPFMIISAKAIDILYQKRLTILAEAGEIRSEADWPFCEGFIASTLMNDTRCKVRSLDEMADLPYFNPGPPIALNSPLNGRTNCLNHPVLAGGQFISKLLNDDIINGAVHPGGCLENPIYRDSLEQIVPELYWRFRAMGRVADLTRLHDFATAHDIVLPPHKLSQAHGKPATQSSICEYSIGKSPEDDARRANSPRPYGIGFHTAYETDPWWQCDLEKPTTVSRIVLFNRMENQARCLRFSILRSDDGADWTLAATKLDATMFGGADGNPFICELHPPQLTQYIRVQAIGMGFLHLDQIELY